MHKYLTRLLFLSFLLFGASSQAATPLITCHGTNQALQSTANPPTYSCTTISGGGGGGSPGGSSGQTQYNNAGAFGGYTMSGDCTINTSTGAITCTKTGGNAFATSATTDTTNASNISSGVLGSSRGGAGTVNGILKANGSGVVSQAVAGTDYVVPSALSSYVPYTGATTNVNLGTHTLSSGPITADGNLIANSADRFFLIETTGLTAGFGTEVNGQLADFGTNYAQAANYDSSQFGSYFRIDTRTGYINGGTSSNQGFSVKIYPNDGSAQENVVFGVAWDGSTTNGGGVGGVSGQNLIIGATFQDQPSTYDSNNTTDYYLGFGSSTNAAGVNGLGLLHYGYDSSGNQYQWDLPSKNGTVAMLSDIPVVPANTASTTHQFFNSYNSSSGAFGKAQPAFSDISGTASNSQLANSTITIAGTSTALGSSISQDTITGLSSTGIVKRTGANALAIATSGTDYAPATSGTSILKASSGGFANAVAGTDYEVPLTFSTGLTRSTNTITVNTSQNISTLSNLTSNGFVKTSGGTGALSIDTNSYMTNPMTTSGDIIYGSTSGAATRLAANATATNKYLQSVSSGTPVWVQIAAGDVSGLAASATTDTTNASNITSGTLAAARGGAGTISGALKANGSGVVSQAGCSDLSNGATGCSTATGTSGATIPLLNGANTWSGVQSFSSGDLAVKGSTSGGLTINTAAVAGSNTITFPAGTTNFSSTGGTSQVVEQTSAGGAFTVARLACSDLSNSGTACTAVAPSTISSVSHNFLTSFTSSTGGFTQAQPAFTDISGTATTAQLPTNATKKNVVFNIDGAGTAIQSGGTWYLANIPYSGTITSWSLVADVSGSIVIDVWKANAAVPTVSNTITASALPTLSSAQSAFSGAITGWTTSVSAGDVFAFHINSASTVTKANLTIQITLN